MYFDRHRLYQLTNGLYKEKITLVSRRFKKKETKTIRTVTNSKQVILHSSLIFMEKAYIGSFGGHICKMYTKGESRTTSTRITDPLIPSVTTLLNTGSQSFISTQGVTGPCIKVPTIHSFFTGIYNQPSNIKPPSPL